MSVESAKKFLEELKNNKELEKEVQELMGRQECKGTYSKEIVQILIDSLVAIANEHGFGISVQDIESTLTARGEVSDKELDAVVGGLGGEPKNAMNVLKLYIM